MTNPDFLTSFVASPQAKALARPAAAVARKVGGLFLGASRRTLDKSLAEMDAGDVHNVLGHVLPGALKRRDPLAEHVPAVLYAMVDFLEASGGISDGSDLRRGLDGTVEEFQITVRTGKNPHHQHHHHGHAQHAVRRETPKVGRNAPCPCASGRKYKQCHGVGA